MTHIVMDLEWNQTDKRNKPVMNGIRLTGEIIQIGAVKLDENFQETDQFSCFVKPENLTKLNKRITELTGITQEQIDNGDPFPTAAKNFLSWCGDDFAFITWSENDIYMLEDNMEAFGLSIDDLPVCYDIQLMYNDQITLDEEDRRYPLNHAMWKFDIKPSDMHNALDDAISTTKVLHHLDLTEGLEGYEV